MDAAWSGLVDSWTRSDDPLVGSVLVRDVDLPAALEWGTPLRVVSTGGAGALAGPLRLAARAGVALAGLQTTLRDPGDPVGAARRVVAALDAAAEEGLVSDELDVVVEAPPAYGVERVLDVLAERELVWGLPIPPAARPDEVVGWLDAALDRETPYVVTGGVERAVTGPDGPGVVNLLAATRSAFDGRPAAAVLTESDPAALLAVEGLAGARRWLRSVVVPDGTGVRADLHRLLG